MRSERRLPSQPWPLPASGFRSQTLRERLEARRQEAADFERVREAESAERELPDLRERLASLKARQDHFLSYGDRHIEFAQTAAYGSYGQIELAPQRSLFTGKALAKMVQRKIDEIAGLISAREMLIAELAA